MKSLGLGLLNFLLLISVLSCGKKNESGKSSASSFPFNNPYGVNPTQVGTVTPYSYQGINLGAVLAQNPCMVNGAPGPSQRHVVQVPLVNFQTAVAPSDIYVGVTSYGDVAAVVGQAIGQPPLFISYICPRAFASAGQGQLLGIKIGAYSNCYLKPITAATMIFPGGMTADFRWLDGGNSLRQPFTPPLCR